MTGATTPSVEKGGAAPRPPRDAEESTRHREELAERIAAALHGPVTLLGVIFLLVLVGQFLAEPGSAAERILQVAGWTIWAVFAVEFLARMAIAPSTGRFLRRNWWQLAFLVVPFLRFLSLVRAARTGRSLASAVRAGRTAAGRLGQRVGWLIGVTVVIVLGSSELLVQAGSFDSMAEALYASALATITGEPLGREDGMAKTLNIVLGLYSVLVFAALAGALGAFFLDRQRPRRDEERT